MMRREDERLGPQLRSPRSFERHPREQREREARLAEEATKAATLNQPVPVVAVPAREGLSALENMMAQDGYTSLRDEFERFPRPSSLDDEFARTREHQRAEQEVARRKEKAK